MRLYAKNTDFAWKLSVKSTQRGFFKLENYFTRVEPRQNSTYKSEVLDDRQIFNAIPRVLFRMLIQP